MVDIHTKQQEEQVKAIKGNSSTQKKNGITRNQGQTEELGRSINYDED